MSDQLDFELLSQIDLRFSFSGLLHNRFDNLYFRLYFQTYHGCRIVYYFDHQNNRNRNDMMTQLPHQSY